MNATGSANRNDDKDGRPHAIVPCGLGLRLLIGFYVLVLAYRAQRALGPGRSHCCEAARRGPVVADLGELPDRFVDPGEFGDAGSSSAAEAGR